MVECWKIPPDGTILRKFQLLHNFSANMEFHTCPEQFIFPASPNQSSQIDQAALSLSRAFSIFPQRNPLESRLLAGQGHLRTTCCYPICSATTSCKTIVNCHHPPFVQRSDNSDPNNLLNLDCIHSKRCCKGDFSGNFEFNDEKRKIIAQRHRRIICLNLFP